MEKNMILCIGEILADMISEDEKSSSFKMFCGGAPFNVAVNAKQSGAKVGFIGKVGKDLVGKFLIEQTQKANLDYINVGVDKKRNTTLAFVTLKNGERDFSFFRNDTADFNLSISKVKLNLFSDLSIVHLGSLMLSEKKGQNFANNIMRQIDDKKVLMSFDVNFRKDLYSNFEDAKKAYTPFINRADILKFSDDEILEYTGMNNLEDAILNLYKKDRLLLVTLGSKGSMYSINGHTNVVPTPKVTPIDTTGAGDSFFGALLADLDGKEFTISNIETALIKANQVGAKTTQFKGAIRL